MNSLWKTPCIKPGLVLKRRLEKWMPNYKWSQECSSIRRTYERYLREKRIAEQQSYLRARRIAAAGKREKGKGKEDDIEAKKHNEAVGAGEKKREAKKGAVNNFDLIGEGEGKEGEGAYDIEAKKHNEAVGAGEKKREAKKGAVNNFDLIGEGEGKEGEGAYDIEAKKHNEAVGAGEKKREAKKGAVNNFDLIGEGEGKEGEGAVHNSGPRSLRVTKKSNHKRAKNPEETPKKKMRVAGVGENI